MPITINDCAKCGKPPEINFKVMDAWEGAFDVILFCDNPKCKVEEGWGGGLGEVVEDWNKHHGEDKR